MHELAVTGGYLVTEYGVQPGNLYADAGRITAIEDGGPPQPSARTIYADGLHILPGLIDAHVHLREPGLAYKEGVANGSRAAAVAGVTTAIVMPTDDPMTADGVTFAQKREIGRQSHVDYSLTAIMQPDTPVAALVADGCCAFEIFLADVPAPFLLTDPDELLRQMRILAAQGMIAGVTPTLEALTGSATRRAVADGRIAPGDFAAARPPVSESMGVGMACEAAIATGCRLHLRQITSAESVEVIRASKARRPGLITAETLPHNLLLTDTALSRLGPYAKMAPPLRPARHTEALWQGLKDGTIDIIVTDHAPHLPAEKQAGEQDIWKAPSGIPGLETLLPTLLQESVAGRIALPDIVRWTAATPARLFGFTGRKGAIMPGYDADLVLVDLAAHRPFDEGTMITRAKRTPFHGRDLPVPPRTVLLRGHVIAADGQTLGDPAGQFLSPAR